MSEGDARSIKESLARVVSGLGTDVGIVELHQRWEELVGSAVSSNCRPRRVVDGRLVVEVSQPGWATELRFLERQLVTLLSDAVPELRIEGLMIKVRQDGG